MTVLFMKLSFGKDVPIFRSALQSHTWSITPISLTNFRMQGVWVFSAIASSFYVWICNIHERIDWRIVFVNRSWRLRGLLLEQCTRLLMWWTVSSNLALHVVRNDSHQHVFTSITSQHSLHTKRPASNPRLTGTYRTEFLSPNKTNCTSE
jgi:hypothetical protein